jgi:hypothetical protein
VAVEEGVDHGRGVELGDARLGPASGPQALPERYGPWKTVYTRFRRYALEGVFNQALQQSRTAPLR